jgi:carbon dioxide concentrating mechanism protein CcmN
MHIPLLQPIRSTHTQIVGDVLIHDSAVLAPGVLLLAEPGSQTVIAAGVCIGMGSILHARQGTLEVGSGALLGAGVLIVGSGRIGASVCIGAATTLFNCSVDPGTIIPAGSLLGDESRRITLETGVQISQVPSGIQVASEVSVALPQAPAPAAPDPWETVPADRTPTVEASPTPTTPQPEVPLDSSEELPQRPGQSVYGQVKLNQLLVTLLPYRQSLHTPPQPQQLPEDT